MRFTNKYVSLFSWAHSLVGETDQKINHYGRARGLEKGNQEWLGEVLRGERALELTIKGQVGGYRVDGVSQLDQAGTWFTEELRVAWLDGALVETELLTWTKGSTWPVWPTCSELPSRKPSRPHFRVHLSFWAKVTLISACPSQPLSNKSQLGKKVPPVRHPLCAVFALERPVFP